MPQLAHTGTHTHSRHSNRDWLDNQGWPGGVTGSDQGKGPRERMKGVTVTSQLMTMRVMWATLSDFIVEQVTSSMCDVSCDPAFCEQRLKHETCCLFEAPNFKYSVLENDQTERSTCLYLLWHTSY